MEQKRKASEQRIKQKGKQKSIQDHVGRTLSVDQRWWGGDDSDSSSVDSDLEDEEDNSEKIYVSTIRPRYLIVILKHSQTPPADFSSMLVFSPPALPQIFDSLITNFQPSLRNSQPANTLYLLARFACLTCDHNWLEDLIMGATDAIEETFFVSMSLSRLSFISLTIYRRTDRTILHVWCFGYTTLPCGYT